MDARNRDELLKKQENLEAYLLENPKSSLFAWYARQNMEAGEIERALQICKLGLGSVEEKGTLHKLMGEIFMARGEVTQSMKHYVECILTGEPFPGAIIEVLKNMGDTMDAGQQAFLVHLLNKALPGHPDATRYYKKHPDARNFEIQPGQYKQLEQLVLNLERSAMVEVLPLDEDEEMAPPELAAPELDSETVVPEQPVSAPEPEPATPFVDPNVEPQTEAPVSFEQDDVPEVEIPDAPPLDDLLKDPANLADPVPEPLPEPAEPPKPKEKSIPRQAPAVKHNITRSMATFTLMQIFKDQGMYDNALEVLQFLREKSSNTERIENEEKEIRDLMEQNGIR